MLTKREIKILYILLKNNCIKAKDLANSLEVSTRTIIRDINNLTLYLKKFDIIVDSTNNGYCLTIRNIEKRNELIQSLKMYDPKEIYKEIFVLILENPSIDLYEISENIYESDSSTSLKLRSLKESLEKYQIRIVSNNGFKVVGDEEDIRSYLLKNYMFIKDNIFYGTSLNTCFGKDAHKLKNIVTKYLIDNEIIISDVEYANLIGLIIVTVYRYGNPINSENTVYNPIVNSLISNINKEMNIDLDINDASYIIENSVFNDNYLKKDLNTSIESVIELSIEKIKNTSINNYYFDNVFLDSLKKHLMFLVKRNFNNIKIKNPLIQDLKKKYIIEFNDAIIFKEELIKEFNINLNQDEIGYLAIHLGAAKTRLNNKEVIIICNYGFGTSQIVKLKIEKQYPDLKVIGLYPISYLELAIEQNPDYIISTVNIFGDTKGIPVIDASNILYSDELLNFDISSNYNIYNLLYDDLFFDVDVKNKNEFFKIALDLISENYNIERKKLDSVLEHEKIVSTDVGNLIAIPHTIQDGKFKSFIAIFRLKNQIIWNIEKVKFVFIIVINSEEKKYIDTLSNLYKYILNPSNTSKMIKAKTLQEFIGNI